MIKKHFIVFTTLFSIFSVSAMAEGTASGNNYPPSLVKTFMEGCASDPDYKDFCSCTIETLQTKMSLYDFIEIGNAKEGALEKDARFTESTNACLSKVKSK